MRKLALVLVLATAVSAFGAGKKPNVPPTTAQAIDVAQRWLDIQRMYDAIPAMSAAVVQDQKEIWSGGSGLADPATRRTADADTIYSICSISKLFTSLSVMQLRDEGKVSLDEPIAKYLSWFTMKPAPEGRDVTLRGILTHSAGLPRESDYPYWSGEFDFPTHEQIVEKLPAQEALYPSSRYFQYSNLGLTLAGEIVSAVSGQPYGQYVREHLIQPIGLTSTFPEIPLQEQGKRLAVGFSAKRRDGTRAALPAFQARGVAPAAGFASTANDLARFAQWQFRVLDNKDDKVIDPRTLREMQRAAFVSADLTSFWGLGFSVWKSGDDVFVGHQGSCPGFRTALTLDPAEKIAVAVLANASGVPAGDYAKAIYDIVKPALKNDKPVPASTFDPTPYAGSYNRTPFGGETMIVAWGDGLAAIDLPTMTPMKNLERLRPVGEHKFRRVRPDGELGETVTFDVGADGKATRMWWFSNPYPRLQ